jgi:DNA-binding transcriptional MerR regulator/methylmalonyl-CoA mutase cobalamin-binding subunit
MMEPDTAGEPRHPIGVVAERTGLSQDVLRVWERRYEAVAPGRGRGGQRLYSDLDIERLRLLALATTIGRNIGQVAGLPTGELRQLVRDDERGRGREPGATGQLETMPAAGAVEEAVDLMRSLDATGLDAVLRRAVVIAGLPSFLESVAAPLLGRIGDEWQAGRLGPAQEHLASAVVQAVISSAMQALPRSPAAPHIVLGTLTGERHELGALLAAATATAAGWRVTYLGADLSGAEIAQVALATAARVVGVSVVHVPDHGALLSELHELRRRLPVDVAVIVGGHGGTRTALDLEGEGITVVASLAGLRARLRAMGEPGPATS